ncbi:uncharacterized protein LOC117123592 isoform X2 [Anneissia japonica]|nr:uncharacterized protein LOC117123592 isoform X2 [Anneissia japonica]
MTNLEFLNFWISSIFSHVKANEQEQDGDGLLSPPVFIVGTHLDCIPGTDEEKQRKLDEISKIIKDYLGDKAYRGHVVPQIYFVDNKFRQGESLKKFREHVEEVMRKQPYMNKMIQVSWFRFQNHVMKLRKETNYITLKEAMEISTRFGVQNDDIFDMLQLFHDVGVVAFYGERNSNSEAFNDIVVLNPQWLIIIFTKIITINKDEENWPAYKKYWSKLEEKGILEEKLVNHVWSKFPKNQRESLLQIMERFDLLCENKTVEGETHYTEEGQFCRQFFVPCQLKPNKEDIGRVWELERNAVVINIIPKDKFLPEGLFHRLTVRAAVWTQQKEGCQSKQPRLYYRQTELYLDEDHELIMKMHVTNKGDRMIKIIIYYPPVGNDESSRLPTPSMCKEVFVFLLNSLKNLKMMWMKQIDFHLHVPCYTCKEFDDHHHLLETCLKQKKTDCGRKRELTTFWQNLFGDTQVNQVVKHPLESLAKTNDNQTNKMPVSSFGTGLTSSLGNDNSGITSSTKKLITELTPADESNQDEGVKINVIGDKNIVIVNNKGIIEINEAQQSTNYRVKTKRSAEKLDPNIHKCNECDRVCRSKAGLVSHLRRHSVKPRTDYSPDKPTRETSEGSCSYRSSPIQTPENMQQTRQ